MPRAILATILAVSAVAGALTAAGAQDYPNRPITLVVSFPPGGSTGIVARIVADEMSRSLGQQIVIDNRGGAGGTIGSRQVAKAAPDGYTLLLGYTGTLAIGPTLYPNVGYDPRKDFAPVGMIGHAPNSLVVHPSFPAKTVKELIDYAKANPGKVQYGSAGVGTVSHVTGVYFASAAGIELAHVPYRGTGPAVADLLGGHIPMAFAPIPATHANIAGGKLRGLAVTSAKRSSLLPDLPTVAESGVPGFEGSLFTNKSLAATYARVLKEAESAGGDRVAQIERARKVWSQGFVAEAIDRFCRSQEIMDVTGRRHRGVLTGDDMARWQAHVEAPLTYDYRNYTVCKAGPWSQGPVLLQQLALLKGCDLDGLDPVGPDFIHLLVEASKLAYADRETFYGDPDFVDVPMPTLLSDAYNAQRRKLIADTASLELRPGSVEGFGAVLQMRRDDGPRIGVGSFGAGEPTVGKLGEVRGDTVHFDIIDQAGNMVSATPSGGWLQSSPVIPELGFCLGTRAQMFWLEEGHPASLAPGKRPRTTLSPTMALRDGEPYLAWGSPGGDQQDQWTAQLLLRHVHCGHNLQEAIDAPAWHSEHFPSSFWPRTARPGVLGLESRVPEATRKELERRGHVVETGADWSEGRLTAASRVGRRRRAAANPRGMQGYAAGR